ncbi:WAT1-related protein At3g30340-like [Telopea speciosissima]|uniref:WAT1-related protein At3g30340-like n=1 Tax=Telopea speciosissima TaxID=54955 RepID=UPI001CC417FD|nr:WAT1-related protein At3g30340-like [Telopea speciosissima]
MPAAENKCWEEWKPMLAMVGVDIALATVNLLLKKVLEQGLLNHLVLVTYRQSISTLFLAPLAYFWERKSRPKLTPLILCYLFFSAMLGATITQNLFLYGIDFTSATFSCAFINMVPAITFLLAIPFRLESVKLKSMSGRAKALGTTICVGGGMLLILYKGIPLTKPMMIMNSNQLRNYYALPPTITNQQQGSPPSSAYFSSSSRRLSLNPNKGAGERWTIGSLALVAGSICWSSWFLLQSKIGKHYPCHYSSTAIMSFFGAFQSALLSLLFHRDISMWILKGRVEIFTVLYTGIMGSGLCYVGMAWCVKKRGPLFTAAFSPLIQIIVAMFDFSILHEQLYIGSILGSILVIVGLYVLLWGKSKEAKDNVTKPLVEAEEQVDQATHI